MSRIATMAKLGPADHGRPMTFEEYMGGDYRQGYHYELIDGRLYVSPEANMPQDFVEQWLYVKTLRYSRRHPEIINYVSCKARVFIPGRHAVTAPEPDLAAYQNFPVRVDLATLRWEDFSPLLIGEVLSLDDPDKDLVRNVKLYWQVPSIKEYWVVDTRDNPNYPTMHVYRRQSRKWEILEVGYGERYTTPVLPGFKLLLDPRR
jgi:Uma2 family endonuclease